MGAIIRMLSSGHDGEVVNAARALGRILTEHGKDWNDLGTYLESWPGIAEAAPERQHEPYPSKGPSWQRRAAPEEVDIDEVHTKLQELAGYTHLMRRQDRDFVEGRLDAFDMYRERTMVTPGQRNYVEGLYVRYCENKGRRHR
jgi:hypothetical protein